MEATEHIRRSNISNKQLKMSEEFHEEFLPSCGTDSMAHSDMQGALLLKWVLCPPPPPSHFEALNSSVPSDKICKNVQIAGGRIANMDKFFLLWSLSRSIILNRLLFK